MVERETVLKTPKGEKKTNLENRLHRRSTNQSLKITGTHLIKLCAAKSSGRQSINEPWRNLEDISTSMLTKNAPLKLEVTIFQGVFDFQKFLLSNHKIMS